MQSKDGKLKELQALRDRPLSILGCFIRKHICSGAELLEHERREECGGSVRSAIVLGMIRADFADCLRMFSSFCSVWLSRDAVEPR